MNILDLALTLDDQLYEKFKYLNRQLHEEANRLRLEGQIRRVQVRCKGGYKVLRIEKIAYTPNGLIITCL